MANWLSVRGYNEFGCDQSKPRSLSSVWEADSPHSRFWKRLINQNVDNMINDPEKLILKHLRYDNEMLKRYERDFGKVLAERGLTFCRLIADAYGENWDLGKNSSPCNQRNHDDLDPAREIGLSEGQGRGYVLQGCPQSRGKNLDKERGGLVKKV